MLVHRDIEIGSTIVIYFQTFGGALAASICQAIYQNLAIEEIGKIPGIDAIGGAFAVISSGVTGFRDFVPAALLPQVVDAFSFAITRTFFVGTVALSLGTVGVLALKWVPFVPNPAAGPAV